MDYVLVELPMPDFRTHPIAFFSAFVEAPFDALDGVGPADPLPIQGVAWDKAIRDEYVAAPVIAFPFPDEAMIGTVAGEEKIFSLLVDLTSFTSTDVIRIGLYGYVESYEQTGAPGVDGEGKDGPFYGTVNDFIWTGVTRLTVSGDTPPITPAEILGAPQGNFKIRFADLHDPLMNCFPELADLAYTIGGASTINALDGDPPFDPFAYVTSNVGFDWDLPGHPGVWWGDPATEDPNDNPDDFIFFVGPERVTDTEWAPGFLKKRHVEGMFITYLNTVDIRYTEAPDVETPPPVGTIGLSISYGSAYLYSVPVWKFINDRPAPVNVAHSTGINLWTQQAEHTYTSGSSLTWEIDDYPDRPEMAEIGTAVVFNADAADGDVVPSNHFGQLRIGTITINRGSGEITFMPVEIPPTDGTPDGDGLIGDGTAPGRTDNPQLRVWTFSLDGHDYYVLRLGDFDQLVYDVYSEQWVDWNDFDSLTWRAHCGMNWIGAEALADTYGSSVIAGDDTEGLLWFLDPEQPYDDDPFGGAPTYFARVTVGQVPMTGREVLPCYAAWLTTDMGDPAYLGAAVTLWTSDDAGVTWDNQGYVRVTADENSPELSWYSLGQIGAPGRLFKIFNDGAVTRIDALEMNDPDDEK